MAMHMVTNISIMNYDIEIGLEKMKVYRWSLLGSFYNPNDHSKELPGREKWR